MLHLINVGGVDGVNGGSVQKKYCFFLLKYTTTLAIEKIKVTLYRITLLSSSWFPVQTNDYDELEQVQNVCLDDVIKKLGSWRNPLASLLLNFSLNLRYISIIMAINSFIFLDYDLSFAFTLHVYVIITMSDRLWINFRRALRQLVADVSGKVQNGCCCGWQGANC